MAFVTLEDTSGSIEMLVFPQTYDQYRYLLEENQVLCIEARLSIREDEETKLVCRSVALPQEAVGQAKPTPKNNPTAPAAAAPVRSATKPTETGMRKKTGKRPGLYLRVPSKESREFLKSEQYLDIFEGFSDMYGSMTTIVLIMLWLYFSMYIMLLGGKVNMYFQEKNKEKSRK